MKTTINFSKDILLLTFFVSLTALLFSNCTANVMQDSDLIIKPDSVTNEQISVTDVDSIVYKTVTIGNQVWMAENLRVTHYRDLSKIISERVYNQSTDIEPDILYYNDNADYYVEKFVPEKPEKYGALYSWNAVKNPKGLAPAGWHIATIKDWEELIACLGGKEIAGGHLKSNELETGIKKFWANDSTSDNSSGFNARPGGYSDVTFRGGRYYRPISRFLGEKARFWAAMENINSDLPTSYFLIKEEKEIRSQVCEGAEMCYPLNISVRCVKNK